MIGSPSLSKMSLLHQVEEAVKWCKAEQAKLHGNIQLYKEILKSLTLQTPASLDLDDAAKGSEEDVLPQEKEEIELLERALKEALRIRSGGGSTSSKGPRCSRGPPRPNKESGDTAVVKPSEANQSSGTRRGKPAAETSSESSSLAPRGTRKPGISSLSGARSKTVNHLAAYKGAVGGGSVGTRPASSSVVRREKHTRVGCNPGDRGQAHAAVSSLESDGPLGKAGAPVEVASHAGDAGTRGTPAQNRIPSDLTEKWKSLRMKQNRLWDKATVMQSQSVPERSAFMEKMGAFFPRSWPRGSPNQTRALVGRLTRQGQDLCHCYQVQKLLAKHGSSSGTQPDSEELQCAPHVTLENLESQAASLRKYAVQVKQEWEAWDRWRPEGGCLCPDERGGQWAGEPPLPPTVIVTTETELVELERLRLRVVLLQQEVYLQQALSDSLSPQLPSLLAGPGPADCSVLRDVYSLLAEGGERFPTLVLDTEPD